MNKFGKGLASQQVCSALFINQNNIIVEANPEKEPVGTYPAEFYHEIELNPFEFIISAKV